MKKILLSFFVILSCVSFSQTNNSLIVNGGFEFGDFRGWSLYEGEVNANPYEIINVNQVYEPSDQHKVYFSGNDAIISTLPRVNPLGGGFSAMIGDGTTIGGKAAKISQFFRVDSTNMNFIFHCAIVLENPSGHTLGEQPFFSAALYDSTGQTQVLDLFSVDGESATISPNFIPFTSGLTYQPWTAFNVDLSSYLGQQLKIEFKIGDCSQSGHYAYAYIDTDLGLLNDEPCYDFGVSFENLSPIECLGSGSVEAVVNNGVLPYTYNWSSGDSIGTIALDTAGTYYVTVTDSLGCVTTDSLVVDSIQYPSSYDLEASMYAINFQSNQTTRLNLRAFNNGCDTITNQLQLILDDKTTYVNANPTPIISGDTLRWDLPLLTFDSLDYTAYVDVITDAVTNFGDTLCFNVEITPIIGDVNSGNNMRNYCYQVISNDNNNDSLINSCFEYGDFSGWNLVVGDVNTNLYEVVNDVSVIEPSVQHQIVSSGNDAITGQPKVFPGGGNFSMMLGDSIGTGGKVAKMEQTFKVDSSNVDFIYHYAIVFEAPTGHSIGEQPFYTATFYDAQGQVIDEVKANGWDSSSGNDPDFVALVNEVYYLPWKTRQVDLSSYFNEQVTVEFVTGDCSQMGHYSYAYIDASCHDEDPDSCAYYNFVFNNYSAASCINPGNVDVTIYNGTPPYNYQWSSGDTTSNLNPMVGGIYDLMVTDSLGCEKTKSILVGEPVYPLDFDLEANFHSGAFRVGQTTRIDLAAFNNGCDTVVGQLKLVLDDLVSYSSGSPIPTINGDTLTWNLPQLAADSIGYTPYVYVVTSTSANIGDTVCFDVEITPIAGDVDTTNNFKHYCKTVVNSYDPNYKAVYPQGDCDPNYVLSDQKLTYTVHFQNTGTAPAININVLDTLHTSLDINTSRVVAQSHNGLITEVVNGSTLNFVFDNINLPDSSSDEAASHGYVVFEIEPIIGITHDTRIENKVGIYFDYNAPIITNIVFNTFVDSIPHQQTILNETTTTDFELNGVVYDSSGTYIQELYSAVGCDSLVVLNLTITPTGVDVVNITNQIKLYPNPINNNLNIDVLGTIESYKIEIYNVTGEVVYEGMNAKTVNTAKFSSGIYYLKLRSGNQVVVKKIVKQ